MKHCIIYIPGLGDSRDFWQQTAVKCWRIFGVRTQFVSMKWYEGGMYEAKLNRVLDAIDEAKNRGYTVSIVGVSAGGSMALNAAAKRRDHIHHVVTICGADDPHAKIAPVTRRRSPSFETSLRMLERSLAEVELSRVHTVRAFIDRVVAGRHTIIAGAHNHIVPSFGHLATITACLTLYAGYIVYLVKRK